MIEYKLKYKNKDFVVNEVPLLPKLESRKFSQYTYVWIKKEGFTTFDAQEKIKNFFNLTYNDVTAEGLKDINAITRQIISIKKILTEKDISFFNNKYSFKKNNIRIENIIGYGKKAVNVRSLHGNSFKIIIRDLEKNDAKKFHDFCLQNRFITFINYYDNQRFGMPDGPYNTHLIGKAIIKDDWEQAYIEFQKSKNILPESNLPDKKTKNKNQYKNFFKSIDQKKLMFFISSYNSFLINAKMSSVLQKSTKGKEYKFKNIGSLFLPKNIIFQSLNICSINGYALSKNYKIYNKTISNNLTVTTTIFPLEINKDKFHKNKYRLTISFFLPTGSYATMIVKQIFIKLLNKNI